MQMTRASYSPVVSQPAGTCSWRRDEISAFPGIVDLDVDGRALRLAIGRIASWRDESWTGCVASKR